jgi:nitrite reductase/ring-hydroxylating ferredoxin subunit
MDDLGDRFRALYDILMEDQPDPPQFPTINVPRRSVWWPGLAAAIVTLAVFGLGALFLPDMARQGQLATEVVAGTVDEIVAHQIVYLPEHRLYVVATDSGFVALSDDSRHVGDRVLFCLSDDSFSSPAHGERFDRLGRYVGGPASGDLGRYQTRVSGGQVLVDTATLELPERSATSDLPTGPNCDGPENPPGFFDDGS